MTESELQDAVLELAALLGWRTAHFRPARTEQGWRTPVGGMGKGFVDLVLVRDRVVFAELKSHKGRLSYDQLQWELALREAGAIYRLWRPENWLNGDIERELRE